MTDFDLEPTRRHCSFSYATPSLQLRVLYNPWGEPSMALRQVLSPLLFPAATLSSASTASFSTRLRTSPLFVQQLIRPILITPIAIPAIIRIRVPLILADIWESILRAVPKKKTSHRKKRQRFLAGKGLKDVTALNKCSACGNVKRAHLLCPFCVNGQFDGHWNTTRQAD